MPAGTWPAARKIPGPIVAPNCNGRTRICQSPGSQVRGRLQAAQGRASKTTARQTSKVAQRSISAPSPWNNNRQGAANAGPRDSGQTVRVAGQMESAPVVKGCFQTVRPTRSKSMAHIRKVMPPFPERPPVKRTGPVWRIRRISTARQSGDFGRCRASRDPRNAGNSRYAGSSRTTCRRPGTIAISHHHSCCRFGHFARKQSSYLEFIACRRILPREFQWRESPSGNQPCPGMATQWCSQSRLDRSIAQKGRRTGAIARPVQCEPAAQKQFEAGRTNHRRPIGT